MKDLLQAKLQDRCGLIVDVNMFGKGFYHVEFDSEEAVETVLKLNPVELRGAVVFFTNWYQGFSLDNALKRGNTFFG